MSASEMKKKTQEAIKAHEQAPLKDIYPNIYRVIEKAAAKGKSRVSMELRGDQIAALKHRGFVVMKGKSYVTGCRCTGYAPGCDCPVEWLKTHYWVISWE